MDKIIFVFCLFLGLFLIFSLNVYACECFENFRPPIVDYSRSNLVFIGKVINVKRISNEPKAEAWKENRTVTFEVLKNYKGINSSTKRIALNTHLDSGSCGLGESPKRDQEWIVFARQNEKTTQLYFGNICGDSSTLLASASDISNYENMIHSIQEKQAVIGAVVDFQETKGIKGIEVFLEKAGQSIKTLTDEKGLFYFPLSNNGIYKITVNIPFTDFFVFDSSLEVQTNKNSKITTDLTKTSQNSLTYEISLKSGEFSYNEIQIVQSK